VKIGARGDLSDRRTLLVSVLRDLQNKVGEFIRG
jgi:hypothetical protein